MDGWMDGCGLLVVRWCSTSWSGSVGEGVCGRKKGGRGVEGGLNKPKYKAYLPTLSLCECLGFQRRLSCVCLLEKEKECHGTF